MRDMTPPGDRSIRNIPIPRGHHHIPRENIPAPYQPESGASRDRSVRPKRRPGRFILLALATAAACAGVVLLVSTWYAGVVLSITPRAETVSASTTLIALSSAPVGTLGYEIVSVTSHATATVPATGTKRVSRQASGVATLSSTYSAAQRLISNTRLEAPDGKIYRLASSVDVPAGGSVTVAIRAESPGESYNRSGATTFTIPGFKGDPRYEKFSAKSAGAIQGGFVGEEPAVAEADMEAARAELKARLDNDAARTLAQRVPETALVLPGSQKMTYGQPVHSASSDKKTAIVSQSATASVAMTNIRDLASALAAKVVEDYRGEAVNFKDLEPLTLIASSSPDDERIIVRTGGDVVLVWQFDQNALKEAVLGKHRSEFQTIVGSFAPAVRSATATLRPFWIQTFPTDPETISVQLEDFDL